MRRQRATISLLIYSFALFTSVTHSGYTMLRERTFKQCLTRCREIWRLAGGSLQASYHSRTRCSSPCEPQRCLEWPHVSLFLAVRAINDPRISRFLCLLRGVRIPLVYLRALNGRWAIRANGLTSPSDSKHHDSAASIHSSPFHSWIFRSPSRRSDYFETFDFDYREAARQ